MKSALALMALVVMVSGHDEVTVNGILGDSVILHCPCPKRDQAKEHRWQKQQPNISMVFKNINNNSVYTAPYSNRAKTFQDEDKNNCSLLLTNITADDQGTYRCSFTSNNMYKYSLVHLNVTALYNVCESILFHPDGKSSEKECHVEGRYRDTEILWYLDEQLLTNSTTTEIMHTHTVRSANHHSFDSKIITKLSGTSEPICKVKAKGISSTYNPDLCPFREGSKQKTSVKGIIPSVPSWRYFKLIPIVLVVGVCLILLHRWKSSRGLQRMKKVEANESSC